MMTDLDIDVPVRTAYNQWTQFEDFPLFMDHVKEVEQLDDTHVRFTASIVGLKRTWEAEITEQTPDQRVAWTAVDGTDNSGVVTFHPLNDTQTRVVLQLEMDPDGVLEHVADKGGFVSDRARKDLASFKDFIEQRGRETGAFRETIERDPHRGEATLRAELEACTKDDLAARADERGVEHRSSMTKAELVDAIVADETGRARS